MAAQIKNKTVCDILFASGDTFRHYMTSGNLKKVIPSMIEKKIINKKIAKHCKKTNDVDLLLSEMKHGMTLTDFIGYLEVLTEFGSYEPYEGETRELMRTMKGSLAEVKPELNSHHDAVIKRFLEVAFAGPSSTGQTQLEGSQLKIQTRITSSQSTSTQENLATDPALTQNPAESSVSDPSSHPSTTQDPKSVITETLVESTSDSHTLRIKASSTAAPVRPPPGQFGDAISNTFTSEGGALYSPVHGVSVTIPPNAILGSVDKFFLSMHFYLGHPFTLMEDVNTCSVVVWFHLSPPIEFLEDVTVEIPHAARADLTSLCVLTWGEDKQGSPYKLNTEVPADFSDGYHAVFELRHFSPYVVARTTNRSEILHRKNKKLALMKRTSTGSSSGSFKTIERMDSNDIERSFKEGLVSLVGRSDSAESDSKPRQLPRQEAVDRELPAASSLEGSPNAMRYSISCGMPRDRSGGQWEVNIAACYSHPTGNWILRQFAEMKFGSEFQFYLQEDAEIRSGCIQLLLGSYEQTPWTVGAPAEQVILEGQIQDTPEISFEKQVFSSHYPPNVSFTVSHNRENNQPASQLNCLIEAQGAFDVNGESLSFSVTSTKAINTGERALYTCAYLYGENSDVMETLINPEKSLVLTTLDSDHIKLIADMSLQLSTAQLQAVSESLDTQYVADDPFENLGNWVCSKKGDARLKDLLQQLGYSSIVLKEEDPSPLLNTGLDKKPISCNYKLFSSLASKIRLCWREVGYLMGISLSEVLTVREEYGPDLYRQSYQLLCQWQRRSDHEATYGTLFKAIHRVFRHRSMRIIDAHTYCVRHVNNNLQSPTHSPPMQD